MGRGRSGDEGGQIKKAERGEALLQGGCGCELAFRYTVSGVL